MIYHLKQPLMIVGLLYVLLFSSLTWTVEPEQTTEPDTSVVTSEQAAQEKAKVTPQDSNSIPSANTEQSPASEPLSVIPTSVEGLQLPEDAQSTIIPTNKATDIRVIIDISGSMKQNDPENLRIPALNLIVEMIPEGARAGVWTFGQWVNMLIPPAIVDDAWREKAKQSAQQINSYGLRTNMGEAMEKATWQFETGGEFEQHAILLTDGLVDIAKESDPKQQSKNDAERQRIATDILKRYQELGVKIHSIGLSDNADKVLLDKLAVETQGSSVVVNSPEQLVKAFLKAFEKAAPEVAEQVPLSNDNTFDIDASVQEFTALVFRKAGSNPMQLMTPSGKAISQIKPVENARWFGESVYDLVTVSNPEPGQWKVEGDLDPDNRITVVSDLKMDINNLPNALFPGQQVDFEVFFHEDGKVISNPDFLKLMTVEMTMTAESGRSGTKVISDPRNPPTDGRYRESISRLSKEGQYELKIEVDGKTFKRMRKDYIQVRQPIGFEIRKVKAGQVDAYAVRVIPQVPDVEVSRTRVIAKLKSPDNSSIIQSMPWIEEGVWEAIIEPNKGEGEYEIALNIKGTIGENKEFRVKPDPIKLVFPIPEDFKHEYLVVEDKQAVSNAGETLKDEAEMTEAAAPEGMMDEPPQELAEDAQENKMAPEAETEAEAEPIAPNLEQKMEEQGEPVTEEAAEDTLPEIEVVAPMNEDDVLTEEQQAALEPIPYWLYAAIPVSALFLGIIGFLMYRKLASKKAAQTEPVAEKGGETAKPTDVSLNDGLDDEDFDDDFDLSGDDDEEMAIDIGDEDGSEMDDEIEPAPEMDDLEEQTPMNNAGASDTVADDIPDFDENFDVDGAAEKDSTSNAIDELDSVLDSLSDEDEENIPQLEESPDDEFDLGTDSADDAEDDNAIDEALANLESELDDIDVDALIDNDKKE